MPIRLKVRNESAVPPILRGHLFDELGTFSYPRAPAMVELGHRFRVHHDHGKRWDGCDAIWSEEGRFRRERER
jgi:hypothetical protein